MKSFPSIGQGLGGFDDLERLLLPPPEIVSEAEMLLPPSSQVLDLGSHSGRNGFFLAQHGHFVTSVELEKDYIDEGLEIARLIGGAALRNSFVQGDMTKLVNEYRNFDAAIATSSFHTIPRRALPFTIQGIQSSVKPRGLNVIQSYVATPEQQAQVPARTLLAPNELFRMYKRSSWDVLDEISYEGHFERQSDGTILFSSYDAIVARRPEPYRRSYMDANRQIKYTS